MEAALAALSLLLKLYTELEPQIQKLIADIKQSGEMTPEQKAAFDAAVEGTKFDPAWTPDAT